MRKLFYIEPSGNLWGSERSLSTLLNYLNRSQWDITLALPKDKPMPQLIHTQPIQYTYPISDCLHQQSRLSRFFNYLKLYRAIKQAKPDLLHLNQAGLSASLAQIAKATHLPLIVHVRLDGEVPVAAKAYKSNTAIHFIAISTFVADQLQESGIPKSQIHQITNPIDLITQEEHNTEDLPSRKRTTNIIGFVGRICPDKGIDHLIQAAAIVLRQEPDTQFWLVGGDGGHRTPGETLYESYYRTKVEQAGLTKKIYFLGFRHDIASVMSHFTLQVMPSPAEPWGRVLPEAMYLKVPVIASASGAATEIIQHEKTGLLYKPMDPASLADAIFRLTQDQQSREQYRTAAEIWAKDHCAPAQHATQVCALYECLLANK